MTLSNSFGLTSVDQTNSTETWQVHGTISRWFQTLIKGNGERRETTNNLGGLLEVNFQDDSWYTITKPRTDTFKQTIPGRITGPCRWEARDKR